MLRRWLLQQRGRLQREHLPVGSYPVIFASTNRNTAKLTSARNADTPATAHSGTPARSAGSCGRAVAAVVGS